ncbi:MAG: type II toxin-antitoxin system RelE/ParE family toxin [Nitrospinae bacterium]|nr:type II toxin-antitoxin system RelE/ParE family toxin [Nitrospinota bacterium]
MVFIESRLFTKYLPEYLTDDEYRELQICLADRPDAGSLIQGTGGLRKLRWKNKGKGKSGGVRVIYYWQTASGQIYFLTIYAKNEMSDLSSAEKKALGKLLEDWNNG